MSRSMRAAGVDDVQRGSRPGRDDPGFRSQVHGSAAPEELSRVDAHVEVDALGTFCPEPVIRTQDRMKRMRPGEVLLLWADDAGVEVDIPAWCMSTRNEFLGMIRDATAYRVYVRKL